ncbi:hypothetical protein KGM_202837B, partial [Danaus plexippus plexippus]
KEKNKQVNAFSGIFLTGEFNDKDWYVHSGASTHMISQSSKSLLKNVSYNLETRDIVVANKKTVPVICSSDIEITTRVRNKEHKVEEDSIKCNVQQTTSPFYCTQVPSLHGDPAIRDELPGGPSDDSRRRFVCATMPPAAPRAKRKSDHV